ncbi:MAG: methyltransferase family protein [Gammaproteobacteria bacterium]
MVRIGNFIFHYRNALFPAVYTLLVLKSQPLLASYRVAAILGFLVALTGQLLRAATIGLEYIKRGGLNRRVYAEKLVQGGLFAHCRNPLYGGNILILLGVGIASNSAVFLSVGVPFFLFAYGAIIAAEEDYLRTKFGQDFDDYCARVNRLLPNLSGLAQTLSGMRFNWHRLIRKEYGSAYIWIAGIILVTLKNIWLAGDYRHGGSVETTLWLSLALLTVGYAIARSMKKKGHLRPVQKPVS